MNERFVPNPVTLEKLLAGPLGAHIDTFAQALNDRGYALWTATYSMRLLAELGPWLEQEQLAIGDLDEVTITGFLKARYRNHRPHRDDRKSLALFLDFLRTTGVLAPPVEHRAREPHSALLETFRAHLVHQRNLASETIRTYLDTVARFLQWRFGAKSPASLGTLCTSDIHAFMLEQARRYSAGHTQLIASALRGFLRFLLQRGSIDTDLAQSVPAPARHQLADLPKFMPSEDVERLMESVDRGQPAGLRDYAILSLLARLGLRAGEVANLRLEDLDWEAGALTIRGKSARVERLPLPWDVGEALAHYLRDGRPTCCTRQVFICLRAPRRGFWNGAAVGTIVRRALAKAGLHPPHHGAHLLRHSLATRLLRGGASLTEIGELLRHRNLDTTRIYAKVDEQALRRLAPSWPGALQ